MKTTMKTSCMVLASLVMTISANAQFSYGAKKKTTPATTTKDTVITKPVTKPVTNNQVVVAPTVSEVKPTKNIDTTVVGGFNANNKRSLRNGYAFFSETNSRKGVKERLPLPYENLREEDALFSEFVWEEIDAREKMSLKGSLDTQLVQNVLDPNVYDTSIIYNTNLAPNPDSIYTFRLKEQWIFDSKTSRMYSRIIGIAPIAAIQIGNKVVKRPLFWVYYPELRTSLAKAEVYNPRNISSRITWEELFESRYFNGYVVKSTLDNYNDKMLNALFKDPIKRLQEGERIKQKIFDFEQDRWVY